MINNMDYKSNELTWSFTVLEAIERKGKVVKVRIPTTEFAIIPITLIASHLKSIDPQIMANVETTWKYISTF